MQTKERCAKDRKGGAGGLCAACLPAWDKAACIARPNRLSPGTELWQWRCSFPSAGPPHPGPSEQHQGALMGEMWGAGGPELQGPWCLCCTGAKEGAAGVEGSWAQPSSSLGYATTWALSIQCVGVSRAAPLPCQTPQSTYILSQNHRIS